jgi:hypothetical protein
MHQSPKQKSKYLRIFFGAFTNLLEQSIPLVLGVSDDIEPITDQLHSLAIALPKIINRSLRKTKIQLQSGSNKGQGQGKNNLIDHEIPFPIAEETKFKFKCKREKRGKPGIGQEGG